MNDGALLAQLMAQGQAAGADLATLRALAEEAGALAAERALARLGLEDLAAARDMGDRRCRVAMAGRRAFARLVAVDGATLTLDRAEPMADAYGSGLIRWFSGANAGLTAAIAASDGALIRLRTTPRTAPAPGDLVQLVEGCDKRIATCTGRFGNAVNFRGEPFLPGIDLLTRYPGG